MLRTLFFNVFAILYMIFSIVFLVPYGFFKITGKSRLANSFLQARASGWARMLLHLAGCKVTVTGLENIPDGNFLIISNHQGNFDILVIIANIPRLIGFIAKKELSYIPIFNYWMKAIGCVIIDRKNMKRSADAIAKGAEMLKAGHSLVVFPEGHRSKSPVMAQFKTGSFKLASISGAIILPVTINGSYKAMEEKHMIRPAGIRLTIHKPIDYSNLSGERISNLAEKLEHIISEAI